MTRDVRVVSYLNVNDQHHGAQNYKVWNFFLIALITCDYCKNCGFSLMFIMWNITSTPFFFHFPSPFILFWELWVTGFWKYFLKCICRCLLCTPYYVGVLTPPSRILGVLGLWSVTELALVIWVVVSWGLEPLSFWLPLSWICSLAALVS